MHPDARRNRAVRRTLHPAVYRLIAGAVVWMLAAFGVFLGQSATSLYLLTVVLAFTAVFALVPWILARWLPDAPEERRMSFREWLEGDLELPGGRIDAKEATAMILTVPVSVALGATALAIAFAGPTYGWW